LKEDSEDRQYVTGRGHPEGLYLKAVFYGGGAKKNLAGGLLPIRNFPSRTAEDETIVVHQRGKKHQNASTKDVKTGIPPGKINSSTIAHS